VVAGCLLLVAVNASLSSSSIVPHPYWLMLPITVLAALWLLCRIERPWWGWAWSVLLLADLWALTWPLVVVCPGDAVHRPSECVTYLAQHWGEHGRVLDRGLAEPADSPLDPALPMLLEIESLRGYNSVDVRRYKEYLQFITDEDRPLRPREAPFGFPIMANFPVKNRPLLDLDRKSVG